MGDLPCHVPCAARRQFGLIKQNAIRSPALLGQMTGQPAPHDTAADDHHPGVGGEGFYRQGVVSFPDRARWLQDIRKSGDLGWLYADMVEAAIRNVEDTFAGSTQRQ